MRSAWETRKRGSATYGNNSETAFLQNAVKKRPPYTRAAERRGEGRERQGGRAELGAAFQHEGAHNAQAKPAKKGAADTPHQKEKPTKKKKGRRTLPSRVSNQRTKEAPTWEAREKIKALQADTGAGKAKTEKQRPTNAHAFTHTPRPQLASAQARAPFLIQRPAQRQRAPRQTPRSEPRRRTTSQGAAHRQVCERPQASRPAPGSGPAQRRQHQSFQVFSAHEPQQRER